MKKFHLLPVFVWSVFFVQARESEVSVTNPSDGTILAGTLAVPDSGAPKALFVMATGSGAQNRDEEIFGYRPFKVISDSLVSNGYAVLRTDDRGVGGSTGDSSAATLDDLTDDAIAGVEYLRSQFPGVKVGILGHSQGGDVAVKAGARNAVDFIVTLAGPAWAGDSLVMSQARALAVALTGSWPQEATHRRLLDIAKSDLPAFTAKMMLYHELAAQVGEAANIPQVQQQLNAQVEPMVSIAYRDLLRYDPADDIQKVRVPWLALNGSKDTQVISDNLKTIKELCLSATTVELPGHNHLFQKATTGLVNEYQTSGSCPTPEAIAVILNWLKDVTF